MKASRNALLGVLAAAWLYGCAASAPPPPPPPPAPTPVPEPEPEPPPPKCEAIKEDCKADADTKARIPGTHYWFRPPAGWTYAQLEECTVAQVGESGAVLMLTTHEKVKRLLKRGKKRGELAASLSELVGIVPKQKRMQLFRASQKSEIAGLDMSLWERAGAKRGDDQGGLLILSAPLGDKTLFGVGFAPRSDDEGTGKILKALQTLEEGDKTEDAAAEEGAGDDDKSDEGEKK
jgi:hypothetical protein